MQASRVTVDQVKQREQVDPNDIYKVPVQAPHFNGSVVLRSEASLPRHEQEPNENADTNNHVQRVQAGHNEVESKENLGVLWICVLIRMARNLFLELERSPGHVMSFELFLVLDPFDAQESQSQYQRQGQVSHQHHAAPSLCRPNRQNHGQAAADQHGGIGG